jgi:hypothetical protein
VAAAGLSVVKAIPTVKVVVAAVVGPVRNFGLRLMI